MAKPPKKRTKFIESASLPQKHGAATLSLLWRAGQVNIMVEPGIDLARQPR